MTKDRRFCQLSGQNHNEFGRVVIDPNADPTLIGCDIVDAVGRDLAELRINEIIDANFLRLSFWLPFPATVLEIADQFLLLGVDRNHRITSRLVLRRPASDMPASDMGELETVKTLGVKAP